MVIVRNTAKAILAMLLFVLAIMVVMVAQLYAPLILWVLSLLAILTVVALPFLLRRRSRRVLATFGISTIVSANFILNAILGGSFADVASYGFGLLAVIWLILFLLSETIASFPPRPSASQRPAS